MTDFVEEVRMKVDIVDLISDYTIIKKTGKNYKGLCPFHQEKTPSFTINPEKQFYYCFGCGVGGDIYKFLMEIENITFKESLKMLAQRAGLTLPEQSPQAKKMMQARERLFEINYLTAKFYNYLLLEDTVAKKARQYLEDRGFSRKDMQDFYLGFAPPTWHSLLKFLLNRDYSKKELVKAGLVSISRNNSYYDRFRDRIIFPIFNTRGEVLAFGGRIITSKDKSVPKYINSPDTLIYKKGTVLYGLNWAREEMRKTNKAIIMEGYTDVLRAHKSGIKTAVASLGTALTNEQARLLKRYADSVYIAYDADTAGARATLRGLDILKKAELKVQVINLPPAVDPDDYLQKEGQTGFEKLINKALGLIDFKIKQIIGEKDLSQAEEKIVISKKLIKMLAMIEDQLEKDIYLKKVAELLELDLDLLKEEVARLSLTISGKKDKNYKNRYTKKDNKTNSLHNINKIELEILKTFVNNPKWRQTIINNLNLDYFSQNIKEIASKLWQEPHTDFVTLIENLNNDNLQKKLMALIVVDEEEVTKSKLEQLIKGLREHNQFQKLASIYQQLFAANKMSLLSLNKLLLDFQHLSVQEERRDDNG